MIFNKLTQLSLICSALTIFGVKAMDSLSQDELNEQLIESIPLNDSKEIQRIIDLKADVNAVDTLSDSSALITAVACEKQNCVKTLLENKANINLADNRGITPSMHLLSKSNKNSSVPTILEYLLQEGNDVNSVDSDGWTALMYAARNGHSDYIENLYKMGADLNFKNKEGFTPLMEAVIYGNFNSVQKLVELGADITVEDNEGKTAIDLAEDKGYKNIADYLTNALRDQVKRRAGIKKILKDDIRLPDELSDIVIGYDI